MWNINFTKFCGEEVSNMDFKEAIARALKQAAFKYNKTPKGGHHKPKKGKGSYERQPKHKKRID